jgi:uncharacterized protein (UPF0303 family)
MSVKDDLEIIARQETDLVFERFDDDLAFAIGSSIRESAKAFDKGITVGVFLWDRTAFVASTKGATHTNLTWAERKSGLVRLTYKSSYRVLLERGDAPRLLEASWAVDPKDIAISGGAFPITVKSAGVIGAIGVSGLHERVDHQLVVEGIVRALGRDQAAYALPTAGV